MVALSLPTLYPVALFVPLITFGLRLETPWLELDTTSVKNKTEEWISKHLESYAVHNSYGN